MRGDAMNKPLVSCIVVSHNKGRWLPDCLRSLINQTYRPMEIVVCDNGSTDNSPEIIRSFDGAMQFKSIFKDEALGVAKAFNLCLSFASGEYIVMLGADDVAKPNHVELLMGAANKHPEADLIYGDIEVIDGNGAYVKKSSAADGLKHIWNRCSIGHATGATKRTLFEEIGGYDESLKMSIDWEFILRAIKAGKNLFYCGETGYRWRRIKGSDQITMKYGLRSKERIEAHSYIRRKHSLVGSCQCGCGAML